MKPLLFQLVIALSWMLPLPALAEAPSAEQLLAKAKAKASAENKTIFLHFGASWCGWCKRLDAFLEKDQVKPVFEKYFVPLKLVVQENDKNKALENAGADTWLQKAGGTGQGLPFSAFLDAKGGFIATSKASTGNIGYPGEPTEIDFFMQMMKKAAPNMSERDAKTLEDVLRSFKNEPAHRPQS